MVRMIAYGPELHLAHPPRPANPKAPWDPEWAVRVRVKSTGMAILGMDERAEAQSKERIKMTKENAQDAPALELPSLGGVLKGLFGR